MVSTSKSPAPPTLGEVLEFADVEAPLTQDIIDALCAEESLANLTADVFGGMDALTFAKRCKAAGVNGVTINVATKILAVLDAALRAASGTSAPVATSFPTEVKLVRDKTYGEMTLSELLTALNEHRDQATDILPFLKQLVTVITAESKSQGAWAVLAADGTIDVEATTAYVNILAQRFSMAQVALSDGRRPVTLDEALGSAEFPYIHPLTGELLVGPDNKGIDWTKVISDELHRAVLWAAIVQHPELPQGDPRSIREELLRQPMSERWQEIVEDFRRALAALDRTAQAVQVRVNPNDASDDRRQAQAPVFKISGSVRDDDWYRQELEKRALARKRLQGGSLTLTRISRGCATSGGSVYCNEAICLEDIATSGGNIQGTVYVPQGIRLKTSGGYDSSNCYVKTWRELYEKAQELGYL